MVQRVRQPGHRQEGARLSFRPRISRWSFVMSQQCFGEMQLQEEVSVHLHETWWLEASLWGGGELRLAAGTRASHPWRMS